ncbi:hypothetical protein RJ45_12345 [Photobacterium gaetbulicola]|uniref:Uncharacterized protein n=1 Tax=Photobacterium gaetbulicola TaxID=1295392 RepID=A0A0B9H2X8_9GAMM|nr:hypothetical protein RJ45_12345 [Photobacterium gaetbulicola]
MKSKFTKTNESKQKYKSNFRIFPNIEKQMKKRNRPGVKPLMKLMVYTEIIESTSIVIPISHY